MRLIPITVDESLAILLQSMGSDQVLHMQFGSGGLAIDPDRDPEWAVTKLAQLRGVTVQELFVLVEG